MKEKASGALIKFSYILFSLLISMALWMYVEITENRLLERDITVREFVFKNRDLLESRRLLISNVLTDNLVLTFEGPRVEMNRLAEAGVTVEIDLDSIRDVGTFPMSYNVILPNNVPGSLVSYTANSTHIYLRIDRYQTVEFNVEVKYTGGTASEELMAEEPIFEPKTVTVSGPEAIVSQIAHIFVPIIAENLSTTYTSDLRILPADENEEPLDAALIESDTLTFSPETIRVTVPIKQLKVLPLNVELSHGTTTSVSNTGWIAEPSQITVAGDPDILKDINSIYLGTIDMTSFGVSTTRTFPIFLPDGLTNESGETEASVRVDIHNLATAWRSVSDLQIINLQPGLRAEIVTLSFDVRIRGTEPDLAMVSSDNLYIVADMSEYSSTGSQRVSEATVYTRGTNAQIDVLSDVIITVSIFDDTGDVP